MFDIRLLHIVVASVFQLTDCYLFETFQASGNQVALSAAAIGATVQTRNVNASSPSTDSQCTIIKTGRYYDVGSNFTAAGFFRLEVFVGQIVYVQSNSTTLSLDEVTAIVETGFSRGQGGRLRFRSLLATNPYFRTVVNVEVLSNSTYPTPVQSPSPNSQPTTMDPQISPSMMPSSFPTFASTEKPLFSPSSLPEYTEYPSSRPSSTPTAVSHPSSSPNINPTSTPSRSKVVTPSPGEINAPSDRPISLPPSLLLSSSPVNTPIDDKQVIVIGSIVGAIGFVLATMFLVICICLPFCTTLKVGSDNDSDNASGSFPGHNSTLTPTTHQMAVPGVLTLDEDAQSLANTTLDGKSSAPIFTPNQAGTSPHRIQMYDSFDESSIYTSTTDPTTQINEAFQVSPNLRDKTCDNTLGKPVTDDSQVSDHLPIITNPQQDQNVSAITTDLESVMSDAKEFDPFEDDNEHFADDESSFEFGSSMALSDPTFATPSGIQAESPTSDETNRIENRISHTTELSASSPESKTTQKTSIGNVSQKTNDTRPTKMIGKTSLENFLNATQATTTFSTSKSVSSLQSAPSRIGAQRPMHGSKTSPMFIGRPPQHDSRRFSSYATPRLSHRISGSSVGPSLRSRLLNNTQMRVNESKHEYPLRNGSNGELLPMDNDTLRTHLFALGTKKVSGFDDPFLNEYVGLQMPSTDSISEVNTLQHALPRQAMSVASYREEFDSPTMNSSRFGNDSSASSLYDSSSASGRSGSWLTDTDEHTFDSTPRLSEYQSGSSRPSRTSRRRYMESERDRDIHVRNERFHHNGVSGTNGISNRPIMDEQKSADHAAGPYSWQSALRTYGPSSISSSSTTGSGSRSTLSSRVDHHIKEQYEVLAPPGKINIVLVTDFHNGYGTVISKVRATSALQGKLREGDELGKTLHWSLQLCT